MQNNAERKNIYTQSYPQLYIDEERKILYIKRVSDYKVHIISLWGFCFLFQSPCQLC